MTVSSSTAVCPLNITFPRQASKLASRDCLPARSVLAKLSISCGLRSQADAGRPVPGGTNRPNSVIAGLTRNPLQIGAEICPGFARVRLRAAAIMDSGRAAGGFAGMTASIRTNFPMDSDWAAGGFRRNDGMWTKVVSWLDGINVYYRESGRLISIAVRIEKARSRFGPSDLPRGDDYSGIPGCITPRL